MLVTVTGLFRSSLALSAPRFTPSVTGRYLSTLTNQVRRKAAAVSANCSAFIGNRSPPAPEGHTCRPMIRLMSVPMVPARELHTLAAFKVHGALQAPGKPDSSFPTIVQEADKAPVLRQVADDVLQEMFGTEKLHKLAKDMIEVMRAAPGVGLAAPQIDIPLKVIVAEDREEFVAKLSEERRKELQREPFEPIVLCNPRLQPVGNDGYRYWEGCLSVSGYQALVDRYLTVDVKAFDIDGKPVNFQATGWKARVVQHECDHVNGTLYIDRAVEGTFMVRKTPSEAEEEIEVGSGPCTCSHELV